MLYKRILNKLCRHLAETTVQRRSPGDLERLSRGSLLYSYGNVYSQVGQDGTSPIAVSDAAQNIHQPLAHILEVVRQHGYTPVCFHQDLYLVRSDLSAAFGDCPKTAEQLYADTYYFLTSEQRTHIHQYRANSPIIRRHETEALGGFDPNPLTSPLPGVPGG